MKNLALTLLLLTFPEFALANTAGQLQQACQSQSADSDIQALHQSGCVFYIRGVMDTHSTFVAIKRLKPIYCEPDSMTFSQIELTFSQWMELNKDKQDWSAADAVLASLAEQFPCAPEKGAAGD